MSAPVRDMTAEELFHHRNEPYRHELIAGRLYEMEPPGALHGAIVAQVGYLLASHVIEHRLGRVFGAETGFQLASDPDTVRAPDAAFVSAERMATTGLPEKYLLGAPDVAVEVLSPSDRPAAVQAKAHAWLDAGARAVALVSPRMATVTVLRSRTDVRVLSEPQVLDLGDVIAGFAVPVAELFA